jgi:hypothetical protein
MWTSYTVISSLVIGGGLLQDGLHHLIAKRGSFRETRCEVLRNALKPVTVGLKVTKRNAVGPCLMKASC